MFLRVIAGIVMAAAVLVGGVSVRGIFDYQTKSAHAAQAASAARTLRTLAIASRNSDADIDEEKVRDADAEKSEADQGASIAAGIVVGSVVIFILAAIVWLLSAQAGNPIQAASAN